MKLHLVSGFLGSGKTTAIINAAKYYMSLGKKVGVITNDQGKYLVDTSFFLKSNIPAVQVSKGCFCTNYENFEEKLKKLQVDEEPDFVFAESIGTSGALGPTVINPLLKFVQDTLSPFSLSVFVDSQLFSIFIRDEELPFSENILYIIQKQIEESKILIINKADLLDDNEKSEIKALAAAKYPEKIIRIQNSTDESDIINWVNLIETSSGSISVKPVDMDYSFYGDGVSELAWLDEEINFEVKDGKVNNKITEFVQQVLQALRNHKATIGHLKFIVTTPTNFSKISITSFENPNWQSELTDLDGQSAHVLLNACVQIEPEILQTIVKNAVQSYEGNTEVTVIAKKANSFKPEKPKPSFYMKN